MELIDKLLEIINNKILEKNIFLACIIIVVICLNLLGINIEHLKNSTTAMVILDIINIISLFTLYPMIMIKVNANNRAINKLNELMEKNEDAIIRDELIKLDTSNNQLLDNITSLVNEFKGMPNTKYLLFSIHSKNVELWNIILREYLRAIVTVEKNNQETVLNTFDSLVIEYTTDYLFDIKELLQKYTLLIDPISEIKNKIYNVKNLLINEFQKNNKTEAKLYVASKMLDDMEKDIEEYIKNYLRNIQANLL